MKLFRYRRPSLNQIFGVTAAQRRVKRVLGSAQIEACTKPSHVRRRLKRRAGLYLPVVEAIRQTAKCRFPTFMEFRRRR